MMETTLESSLDSKEIKPVNLKEINPECSLKGLMLKPMLRHFGHLMRKADSLRWINKVPLYGTENHIQYPMINHNRKEFQKETVCVCVCVCVCNSLFCAAEMNKL